MSRASAPWVLAATIIGSAMAFIDGTVVNVALPQIQLRLGATAVDAQWIVESYSLFLAALILVGGSLGDHFGRRRIFLFGITIFTLASIACGLAQTLLGSVPEHATHPWCREESLSELFVPDLPREHPQGLRR